MQEGRDNQAQHEADVGQVQMVHRGPMLALLAAGMYSRPAGM